MTIKSLKWMAILAPILFVGVLEYARYALAPLLDSWRGHLLMDGVVLMGALFFYGAVFHLVDQMQVKLEHKNRELVALRSAGLDIASELSLEAVLQKVVEGARNLVGTRYGALSVIDDSGQIETFLTSGISQDLGQKIGPPPTGKGLLGVVLREGQRLRLPDLHNDARSCGFPDLHPEMRSLLAVPVICRSFFRGNLYLSEKVNGRGFTEEEEETLVRFATHAAVAIDNADLHRKARGLAIAEERLRIAHEMHDGQAQVLAYVNTKIQAVQEFLRQQRIEEAEEQLTQLAKAAREVYADVREGILGLRLAIDLEAGLVATLREHLEQWQDQTGIEAVLDVRGEPRLEPDVELQLLRIVQEALANVRKHSAAERVIVGIEEQQGWLRITVEDSGQGFDPQALSRRRRPRFGLATMRERAEAIGAALHVESVITEGTRIRVEYPILAEVAVDSLESARDDADTTS